MDKKNLFLIVFGIWIVVALGFVGFKQYTLSAGEKILLKTVPVDPRDWIRGDYVVLNYEISRLSSDEVSFEHNISEGDAVYVVLEKQGKHWSAKQAVINRPEGDLMFIKGEVEYSSSATISIEYGIESYFVPEGRGREIERYTGSELDVEVSVDRFGNAVISRLLINDTPIVFE